jgi:hypothetical protein
MKNHKKYTLTEAASQAMGLGAVSDGKPDYDASGRGSMVPPPLMMTNPATTPVPSPIVPNSMAVAMGGAKMAKSQSEDEETEETEETEEGEEEPTEVEEQIKIDFRNALVTLLGEENASEDLVTKIEAVFEAAVEEKVQNKVSAIVEDVDGNVKNYLENITESLVEKVDDYLDYVVEEWMQENSVAVEQGIKTQIAENFINGLKNLFENHYIDVPNEKYNVLDQLYAQNQELETKLNEAVNTAIDLKKQTELTECAGIFVAETRDLADTQMAKLQSLMENVSFETPEEYRNKLLAIKENYLTNNISNNRVVEPEQTFSKVKSSPTTLVEGYVGALGRLNKKV